MWCFIYIIIPKICLSVCVCVWPPFFSVLRYDRNSRLVSLEPVWPEECPSKKKKKKICQNITSGGITDKKLRHHCFSYGENFALFVPMFETQLFRKLFQQMMNFKKEDTPPMLFSWGKFGAIYFNAWNENI